MMLQQQVLKCALERPPNNLESGMCVFGGARQWRENGWAISNRRTSPVSVGKRTVSQEMVMTLKKSREAVIALCGGKRAHLDREDMCCCSYPMLEIQKFPIEKLMMIGRCRHPKKAKRNETRGGEGVKAFLFWVLLAAAGRVAYLIVERGTMYRIRFW